jgi:hypothetical protein
LLFRARYDCRDDHFSVLVFDVFKTRLRTEDIAVAVTGVSSTDPEIIIEVILAKGPVGGAMWDCAGRTLILSAVISMTVAGLVYGSLRWLAVRPLHHLTDAMIRFRESPEDPERVIVPERRSDEVGVAEQSLADALLHKGCLAGMVTAVTKILHDLKNILATAIFESGRLKAVSDPKINRLTLGMADTVDRTATLAVAIVKFAKEAPLSVKKRALPLRPF